MKTSNTLWMMALVAMLAGCNSHHFAYRHDAPQMKDASRRAKCVPVFLPRTVLEFRCTAVVTTKETNTLVTRGVNRDKARREALLLGITLNTEPNKTTFSIKDPVLTVRGERDPQELYFIELPCGFAEKRDFSEQFSCDGVPGSISSTVENKTFELVAKTIEAGVGVAAKMTAKSPNGPPEPDLLGSVVDEIKSIRKSRQKLIKGQTLCSQMDEKVFSRMLDELAKEETKLTAYFQGASREASFPLVCTIRLPSPEASHRQPLTLFTYNIKTGFVPCFAFDETVQLSSLPKPLLQRDGASPVYADTRCVELRLKKFTDVTQSAAGTNVSQTHRRHGLPYRIPAHVLAEIVEKTPNRTHLSLMKADILLAQWGQVAYLPASLGTPGSTFKPVYYTDTGALKELTVAGTPMSADSLASFDKAAGSIADALKAKADREAAADKERAAKEDELNKLKREADILEQKVRIQGLQEKLPTSQTP
ncbi:MAG: DUF4831 family protein [Phycisphaerales bacterium]